MGMLWASIKYCPILSFRELTNSGIREFAARGRMFVGRSREEGCRFLENRCNGRMDDNLRVIVPGETVVLESGIVQGSVIEGFPFLLVSCLA